MFLILTLDLLFSFWSAFLTFLRFAQRMEDVFLVFFGFEIEPF